MTDVGHWSDTTLADSAFDIYLRRRAALLGVIERIASVYATLGLTTATNALMQMRQHVAADSFKVMIVGEFNRGKSTTINAMLGQKVLPAYAVPTTAIINEVKWGERPRARLYYLSSGPNGAQRVEDIPVDQLEQYVVTKEGGNPYEKVEVY